ncbi:MAG: Asp-tRNA(Asn)/Glu-tRNA(Gln) amidotransferase subunit GatA [Bacilli bacterium]|nr:Asp-tRNA(Asn)/Glu-tRNA(Gln) amidotransferase subunit GatA [Bacilli bacterium]
MKNILELREEIDKGNVTKEELFNNSVDMAKKYQEKYNSFVTILDNYEGIDSNSILSGIPYAMKDNVSTKGILTTGSSNILANYVPVYDATIYEKLKEAGAVLVGKTVLDELAIGGTGTTGHTGVVLNPWDKTRQIGGSSAGSAAAVALGIVPFAIGSDTGDSIRKPAAFGGVVGFKPTYGRISRYGLFAFASSLDHLGVFARNVKDVAIVTDIVKGHDSKDMTSLPDDDREYSKLLDNDVTGRKLFYIKEALENNDNDPEMEKIIENFKVVIEKCKTLGIEVCEESIDKDLLKAMYPTYKAISCAEVTSNDANLTGIHFGVRGEGNTPDEIIMDARTKGFCELIKRRFVLGSYILQRENQEKLFLNACRVRRMIVDRVNELFREYDGIIMPAAEGIAPKLEYESDMLSDKFLILGNHMVIGNFGGYPSITIPSGFVDNMPVGINITGRVKEDDVVLNIANKIEGSMEYANQVAKEMK